MAEVDEEQRRKKKKTKKAGGGKETIGGRWPAIRFKKDLQLNRLQGSHLFTVCFSFVYSCLTILNFSPFSLGFVSSSINPEIFEIDQ